ncbi:MAG TPA: helix-turn-helix domain-containing protein [Acidimicrobiales bacterium]|jgi:DNA-binding transcriptional ArsR family regulator
MAPDVSGFDPAQDVVLDDDSLRVIAHPLRVRLLSELRLHGAATASQLAQRLGQSSGATSYHLRQLATRGFVIEEPDRGTRRERWWRAAHRTTRFDMALDDGNRAAGGEYLRAVARNYSNRLLRFTDEVESVPDVYGPDWATAFTLSDWRLDLTAEGAARLQAEIFELMRRYRDEPPGEGARSVVAQVQLIPALTAP